MVSPTTDRRLGLVGNTAYKAAVTVVATANLTLSGQQTIDGIAVVESNAAGRPDRVLATAQTDASENGLWDVSTGDWTRSKDANGNYDLANGSQVIVARGSHAYEVWVLATSDPITIDTTDQTWSPSLSSGSLATLATSQGASLIGFIQSGAGAVASTVQRKLREEKSVFDFMTAAQIADVLAGTLLLDCSAAFNAFYTAMDAAGGEGVIPFGKYLLSAQTTLSRTSTTNVKIRGAGAELYTSGAISALKISGQATPHITVVEGVKVNHRGNADATAGFELQETNNVRLRNCTVEAHGVGASYAAFWLHNGTASDPNTGCFWTMLEDCTVRKRNGSDVGDIPIGIKLQGAANATTIRGGNIGGTVTDCISITFEAGQTYIANGVLVDGVAFEGGTRAVRVVGAAASTITGLRIKNCRVESMTTFFSIEGTTTQPATPPNLSGNYLDAATAYISNANSIYYYSLDNALNPAIGQVLDTGAAFAIRNRAGSGITLDLQTPTTSLPALSVRNSTGSEIMRIRQGSSSLSARIQDQGGSNLLEVIGARGISKNSNIQANFNGSLQLSSGQGSVAFASTELDTNYFISLAWNTTDIVRWVTLSTTGFTLQASSTASAATVHWHVFR